MEKFNFNPLISLNKIEFYYQVDIIRDYEPPHYYAALRYYACIITRRIATGICGATASTTRR